MSALLRFNQFLAAVDLAAYHERYARIKLVELDLPREVQSIRHLYREYWNRRRGFPSFDRFYKIYRGELSAEIEAFRDQAQFSEETFERGLPARTYRTWASLLTQIQGGYAAERIYGEGNVEMSADLDYRGIDMRFRVAAEEFINVQIKKESLSREVRQAKPIRKRGVEIVLVTYEVPGCDPKTKTGKDCKPFLRWQEEWSGRLKRLKNGFIIFRPEMFAPENLRINPE